MDSPQSITLITAVGQYVGTFKTGSNHVQAQQELLRFAQWFGPDRAISELQPPEVGEYAERAVGLRGGRSAVERLEGVRKFLAFANKKGLTERNLAPHLRASRSKTRPSTAGEAPAPIELTHEGHSALAAELGDLKGQRGPIAVDIRRAAADKDVRENAPLEAAREQLGHVESRIRQIEGTLKGAVIVEQNAQGGAEVSLGSRVKVKDVKTGRETTYTLVGATEAKPLERRISNVSPVGRALVARSAGQEVEVDTPSGTLRYRVIKVYS